MKEINIDTWKRRDHFLLYNSLAYPYLNVTTNVDITRALQWTKEKQRSFFAVMTYITSRAANEIPELRQRIRGNQVIEHDMVRPSFTVLSDNDTFGFATIDFTADFSVFYPRVLKAIETTKQNPSVHDEPGRDDMIFVTTLTWVSFTQVSHPVPLNPPDSFPRITWGKFITQEERILLPLSLMANHALVDGLHVGKFFESVQGYLDHTSDF